MAIHVLIHEDEEGIYVVGAYTNFDDAQNAMEAEIAEDPLFDDNSNVCTGSATSYGIDECASGAYSNYLIDSALLHGTV